MANAREASDAANLDMSQVRPSAKLAISGIEQVMDVLLYGTLEVKQYLAADCDIIFECRICRALFRSLPNFIGHKRMYCTEKMKMQMLIDDDEKADEDDSSVQNTESKNHAQPAPLSDEHPKESSCSPGSLTGPSGAEQTAEKGSSGTSRSKPRNSSGVARSTKTVQQAVSADGSVNGKLTYADVVDFVKKTCKLCGMKAPERRHLVEHVRNQHADRLYFLQCPHCPCSFFITGNLTRHLKNAHNVDAKAADVTLVLPGMNTHAMSVLSIENRAKRAATQRGQPQPSSSSSQLHSRSSSRMRTTFTRASRKRRAPQDSNTATTSTASDNSPAGGNVRKVPQRKLPVDSTDANLNQSLTEPRPGKVGKTVAKATAAKLDDNSRDEEEEDDLSLAAMASRSANGQASGPEEDAALVSLASKVPEVEPQKDSKSTVLGKMPFVLRSRPARSAATANLKSSSNKSEGAVDVSPQVAPPAPKLARLDTAHASRSASSPSSNNNNTDAHLRSALTSATASVVSRSLRKGAATSSLSGEATILGSRSAAKSTDSNSESSSVRSTRRLSLAANPVQSTSSTEVVLDFHCRKCQYASSTLAECASHVLASHGVKVDRRDPQTHIEVCRSQAVNGTADQQGQSATKIASS